MRIAQIARIAVVASLLCGTASADVPGGQVKGRLSLDGAATAGLAFTLVNTQTGQQFVVKASPNGEFTQSLPAGSYVVGGTSSFAIGRAPLVVRVDKGRVASAEIELVRAMATEQGGITIFHSPVTCIQNDEFTVLDAAFDPLDALANGRLYFKSNLSDEWFYTEFQKLEGEFEKLSRTQYDDAGAVVKTTSDISHKWSADGSTESALDADVPPTHRTWLPKVRKDGGIETITYYVQVAGKDFAEIKTREIQLKVVESAGECKGGMIAPTGAPPAAFTIFTGAGAVAGVPVGMAAGAGLGALGVAGIAAGVGAAAAGAGQLGSDPTPTATATPQGPTATPTITPTPTPATCQVTFVVSPTIAADPSVGGPFCRIDAIVNGTAVAVTSSQTVSYPCSGAVDATAYAAPQSSVAGPLPAAWSNFCSGSALGVPCRIAPNPGSTNNSIGLTCSTR